MIELLLNRKAEQLAEQYRQSMHPAALVSSTLLNMLSDRENHPEPWTMAEVLGGKSEAQQEMEDFVDKVQSGEKFEPPPPEVMEVFKRRLEGKA